jgi:hypothetical protein
VRREVLDGALRERLGDLRSKLPIARRVSRDQAVRQRDLVEGSTAKPRQKSAYSESTR